MKKILFIFLLVAGIMFQKANAQVRFHVSIGTQPRYYPAYDYGYYYPQPYYNRTIIYDRWERRRHRDWDDRYERRRGGYGRDWDDRRRSW